MVILVCLWMVAVVWPVVRCLQGRQARINRPALWVPIYLLPGCCLPEGGIRYDVMRWTWPDFFNLWVAWTQAGREKQTKTTSCCTPELQCQSVHLLINAGAGHAANKQTSRRKQEASKSQAAMPKITHFQKVGGQSGRNQTNFQIERVVECVTNYTSWFEYIVLYLNFQNLVFLFLIVSPTLSMFRAGIATQQERPAGSHYTASDFV